MGRRRGWRGGGWIGCFAARNILHYTMGVVYKRLFFFSLGFSLLSLFFSLSFCYFVSLISFFSFVLLWRLSLSGKVGEGEVSFKRWRKQGPTDIPFLRNCGKLAARYSVLRYVTRREKRGEKRIVCQIESGGTKARINDKRVHESLANVLISGERRAREKTFSF